GKNHCWWFGLVEEDVHCPLAAFDGEFGVLDKFRLNFEAMFLHCALITMQARRAGGHIVERTDEADTLMPLHFDKPFDSLIGGRFTCATNHINQWVADLSAKRHNRDVAALNEQVNVLGFQA